MIKAKPFVKWAGGKRQIIDKLLQYVPEEFDVYYEPFVGGGALLFELSPKKAVINDSNKELINVYNVLCNEDKFKKMCNVLNSYETNHSEEFFYKIRNKDRNKSAFNRLSDYKHNHLNLSKKFNWKLYIKPKISIYIIFFKKFINIF